MADLRRLARELAAASYYRRHPLDAARFVAAKIHYRRGRTDPAGLLAGLGLDPTVLEGLARWRITFERMEARIAAAAGPPSVAGAPAAGASDGPGVDQGALSRQSCAFLYGVVRALRPDVVVETGIASGASTAYLAAALADNASGRLISIDLPPYRERVDDGTLYDWEARPVGWAIPDEVRASLGDRHEIVLEDVRTSLPRVLAREATVDLFVHDDLHTPDHMRWEYDLVWSHLRAGGVIVSDDANQAWLDFTRSVGGRADVANVDRMVAARRAVAAPGPRAVTVPAPSGA
jgi:predicted O-methyltransferase YrrM